METVIYSTEYRIHLKIERIAQNKNETVKANSGFQKEVHFEDDIENGPALHHSVDSKPNGDKAINKLHIPLENDNT